MKRSSILAGVLLATISVGITGCNKYVIGSKGENKNIKIIKDTESIKATKRANVKIDKYENMSGVKWIDGNNLIISKLNKEVAPIKIDTKTVKADIDVKNIYSYNLTDKSEKIIGNKSECISEGVVSPDKKNIFYTVEYKKESTGYISNINGDILTKIYDKDINTYDFQNASWVSDTQIIIPCHSIGGFALINTDGKIEKIKDVEQIGNEDPLDSVNIMKPTKVGDKIYYMKIHRGQKEDDKLIVYDTKTKEKKMLIKEDVLEFKLSRDNKKLATVVYNEEKKIHELTIMDLNGLNRNIVANDSIINVDWSKDGKEVAYTSYEEHESGVYTVDVNTGNKILIIQGEGYYDAQYSPNGEKLMVNSTKDLPKDSSKSNKLFPEQISIMNIISFK